MLTMLRTVRTHDVLPGLILAGVARWAVPSPVTVGERCDEAGVAVGWIRPVQEVRRAAAKLCPRRGPMYLPDDEHRRRRSVCHGFADAPERTDAAHSPAADHEEVGRSHVSREALGSRPRYAHLLELLVQTSLEGAPGEPAVEYVEDAKRHPDSAGEVTGTPKRLPRRVGAVQPNDDGLWERWGHRRAGDQNRAGSIVEQLRRDAPKQDAQGPSVAVASHGHGVGHDTCRLCLEHRLGRAYPDRGGDFHPIAGCDPRALEVGLDGGAGGVFRRGRSTRDRGRERSHHAGHDDFHEEEPRAVGGEERCFA